MRTAQEALFNAMISDGWFTDSDGDVASPMGFFAYVTNTSDEVDEILTAFSEVTDVYGIPDASELVGSFLVTIDDRGFMMVNEYDHDINARTAFLALQLRYTDWESGIDE